MKFLRPLFASLFIVITGCTPYKPIGQSEAGGHSMQRLALDVFKVNFDANGFTTPKRASDLAMLRAAEVCMEHGFSMFTILGQEDRATSETIHTGGTAYSTGYLSSYGTYSGTTSYTSNSFEAYKPGLGLTIKCYTKSPGPHAGKVYLASQVAGQLRAQYKIKPQPSAF